MAQTTYHVRNSEVAPRLSISEFLQMSYLYTVGVELGDEGISVREEDALSAQEEGIHAHPVSIASMWPCGEHVEDLHSEQ